MLTMRAAERLVLLLFISLAETHIIVLKVVWLQMIHFNLYMATRNFRKGLSSQLRILLSFNPYCVYNSELT